MDYILQTKNLYKSYGKQVVLNGLNISIPKGSIYGLVGKNGAGKTTLLKMISGLSSATEGEFSLFGCTGKERMQVMNRIDTLVEKVGEIGE